MALTPQQVVDLAPFAATLGVEFLALDATAVRARLTVTPELSTMGGGLHGGALMSLCDIAAAVSLALNLHELVPFSTAQASTHFLRPVRDEAVATAVPLRLGRSLSVIAVEVRDGAGALCGHMTATMALAAPR